MFLLISVVSVVIFSVLCTFLLIRTSKRHYKRELQRMISNITEENSDAEHEYSGYYTMDSMSGARFSSVYNHTERGEYNILSLSQRAYVDDADFSPMTSFHPQNRQLNSETELNDNESLGSVIEAGCLINLFQECEDDLMNDGTESETIAKL
ncbi:uncharacterized protein LOC133172621 [Saccostrea echinata]|uniref:uncharacterized protein LOC133172621 n=1 Tax=Saccostrea echinata TaxID=191078 RepID=UPI002A7F84C9|nr:uncharacterized protein LOC133172621 [Saccostrea echinata]